MSAMSTYLENKLIDFIFRGDHYAAPANTYIGLFTTIPSDISSGIEVSGGSYSRVEIASNLLNWCGTQDTNSVTKSSGISGTTSNNTPIIFPEPMANWGLIVGFGMFDEMVGGNLLLYGELLKYKTVNDGDDAPSFPAGSLSIHLDH